MVYLRKRLLRHNLVTTCSFVRNRWAVLVSLMLFISIFCPSARAMEPATGVLNSNGNVNLPLSIDPTGRTEGFSAVLFDNSNGLPTSEANAIAETSDGYIWIGSYAGLIRYDGNTFERMDSTSGITSIKCLFVDSQDRLWIGTNDNGVAMLNKGELKIWGKLDGMKSAHTRAITEDQSGNIYVATASGIMMFNKDLQLSSMEEEAIADANMRDLRKGNDGTIYGVTDSYDLMRIQDGNLIAYVSLADNPLNGASSILPDPQNPGMLYQENGSLDEHGLYHVDLNDGFHVLEKIDIEPLIYIKATEYIDGKIWICAGNGIGVVEDGQFTLLENLPMNNNVGHVMTDYLGNLWFTSTRQGVMKVVPNQFSDLFGRFELPEKVVNTTCMCDGNLFVGTDTGLIIIGSDGPLDEFPIAKATSASGIDLAWKDLIEQLDGVRIRSIIRDSKERLWISTWRTQGLICLDHGEVTVFTDADGLLSNGIRAICEREDGGILVAVTGGVSLIEDGRVVASYGKEDGILNEETLTVAEGTDGKIVLGSNGGGIFLIDDGGVTNINVEDGLPSDIVMRLKLDKKRDIIWIVTSSAIAYMTPDYKVTTVQKFPYPNNFDVYEDASGNMWVLSSNGIYVVPVEEMVANGELNLVFFGMASGLPCITTANSYSELTPDGDLYIAGSTGVCKVNIDQPFEDVNDLKAIVPYVEADGRILYPDETGGFTIPSNTRKLTISSSVFNYSLSDPQVNYSLEGFDREWTTVNRSDVVPVDYTNLKGGTYSFVMQLKDSLGRGNKTVSVSIVKEKAFFEETWFIIVAGLLLLGTIAATVHFYIQRKTRVLERKQRESHEQFEQTAEALASAIDAKDKYTNGHSRRVAEYSLRIAKEAGMTKEECEKVYFAALLHDVGKIGVPIEILSKKGRLTDEEFGFIKQHPSMGGQILSSIKNSPWLSIGARYHHERYNGRGYPEGLKENDIPEIARIIAVADAYDAMTSNRSYRHAIPQHIVREELVKGSGTQFDPEYAKIMIRMIDMDTEYTMQEQESSQEPSESLRCDTIYNDCTKGIFVLPIKTTRISLCSHPDDGIAEDACLPSLILFDALDGQVHPGEENNKDLLYFEYAKIRLDGRVEECNTRKCEVTVLDQETLVENAGFGEPESEQRYVIEAVRYLDHAIVRISDERQTIQIILALPDKTRFLYISVGGEHCYIHNIMTSVDETPINPDTLPRIMEEISFIKGCPEGDLPNIEVDGWRTATTKGIPIKDAMTLTFHSKSLPTARLVWHCPFISVFSSSDGKVDGKEFREYILLRLDGENWDSEYADNKVLVKQTAEFESWNAWKDKNKQGLDYTVTIRRDRNRIIMQTQNLGIAIESVTTIRDNARDVYIALTGDQCAITNIHLTRDGQKG